VLDKDVLLSPILFNLFMNDVLDDCDKAWGVYLESHYILLLVDFFLADDIVLVAPIPNKLLRKKFLNKVLKMGY